MERSVVILAVAVGGAAMFGASSYSPAKSARELEVTRLERHFDSVNVELRSRDVSRMTVSQKANRAKLVSWLRDYRNADVFPQNDRFAKPTPFFRDKDGVLCAMAYLIDRSGRTDIVNKVAATRNNAYIGELVDDPALVAWLSEWGLSAEEAARIQPTYGGGGGVVDDEDVVESDFALASVALGAASIGSTTWNILRPSYLSGFVGVIAGTASIIYGANYLDDDEYGDGSKPVASAVIGLGAVSLGAGIYGILEARHARDRDHDGYRGPRRRRFDLRVVPDVALREQKPVAGLLVNGRF